MKTEKDFWTHLREYFTVYLPKQRNMSPNTIVSSKQTWNIFLRYLVNVTGIELKNVAMETIDAATVTGFLDCMENEKSGNHPQETRG